MANRLFQQFQGTLEHGIVKLFGLVTTSTSGTIASTDCKGFTITKTAGKTGRYTVTLNDRYQGLRSASVIVEGSADTLYTSAKGLQAYLRGVDVNAASPVLYVQFCDRATAPADAELENGAQFRVELTLKNSTAY